jgi:phosphoribosylamine--glycine ligase
MAELAQCIAWDGDVYKLAEWAVAEGIELTLVGPEAPLVEGIADVFQNNGLKIFGPVQRAAMIEGSKVFAKDLMERFGIPTAQHRSFSDTLEALSYLEQHGVPIVVKDSGLAAGKGVTVATDLHQAKQAVINILGSPEPAEIVIEEFLSGPEVTVLAITDGITIRPLLPSQDHKRLLDGDSGAMTGGMGAVCPYPLAVGVLTEVQERVLQPLIEGLRAEGIVYQGVIYAGIMLTDDGPKVLEFNARFGDPECQAILPLLKSDLVEVALAVCEGRLAGMELEWHPQSSSCVVMAAPGYPEDPHKGLPLSLPTTVLPNTLYFQAGTKQGETSLLTNGGRVLSVVGLGDTLPQAMHNANAAVQIVDFPKALYRRDIGRKVTG